MTYFMKICKHKLYVFIAGLYLNVPIWQLLIHDLSKFSKTEFGPYKRFFPDKLNPTEFMQAWVHHAHKNAHHWEYWILNPAYNFADAINGLVPMPEKYQREMVADWLGASRAYAKSWNMTEWLEANLARINLHPDVDLTDTLEMAKYWWESVEDSNQNTFSLLLGGFLFRILMFFEDESRKGSKIHKK